MVHSSRLKSVNNFKNEYGLRIFIIYLLYLYVRVSKLRRYRVKFHNSKRNKESSRIKKKNLKH